MKTVAIIQARMGSTRLPGKMMMDICGKPAIQRVVERVAKSKVDQIVVATIPNSQEIINWTRGYNGPLGCFVGSEEDVMGRVLMAADFFEADAIVEVTGDCPLIDPRLIDDCLYRFKTDRGLDYVSNCVPIRSYPDGMDCQVYSIEALRSVRAIPVVHNHVGWNIPQHPGIFNCSCIKAGPLYYHPDIRLTLDTKEDLELLRRVTEGCGPDPTLKDYLNILTLNPDWLRINQNVRTKLPEEG
jgi:spore coat polysaccharide biosynthesis protein SpsF